MAKPRDNRPEQQAGNKKMPLGKMNYILMGAGFAMLLLGFILMAGGGSPDPDQFDYGMFSFRRITLAPVIVLAGFALEIYAIMRRPNKKGDSK